MAALQFALCLHALPLIKAKLLISQAARNFILRFKQFTALFKFPFIFYTTIFQQSTSNFQTFSTFEQYMAN